MTRDDASVTLRVSDPVEGRVEHRVRSGEQRLARGQDFRVRDDAAAFDPLPGRRREVPDGVLEHVTAWQLLENGRESTAGRPRAEDARAADGLHPAGEDLRRAVRARVHED